MSGHICGSGRSTINCPACMALDRQRQDAMAAEWRAWMTAPEFLAAEFPETPTPVPYKKTRIPRWLAKQVMERDAYRCQEPGCGTWIDLTVDHIIPESLDGPTVFSNLRTLCRSHNSSKGARV